MFRFVGHSACPSPLDSRLSGHDGDFETVSAMGSPSKIDVGLDPVRNRKFSKNQGEYSLNIVFRLNPPPPPLQQHNARSIILLRW